MSSTSAFDVVVLVAAALSDDGEQQVSQAAIAAQLGLGRSQVYKALRSCGRAGLWDHDSKHVLRPQLIEFLEHGVRYAYPSDVGDVVSGFATRNVAGVLGGPGFVWPSEEGPQRGHAVKPLHRIVPAAARRNANFGEAMRLVDSLRLGRARERTAAAERLREILAA